jgi:hypothetical protein
MPGSNAIWYSAPAAAAAEAETPWHDGDPAYPDEAEQPPEPEPQSAPGEFEYGEPLFEQIVQGWGHLTVIHCAYACIAVHRDPAARSFPALYEGARQAGWRADAYGRWCCRRCAQMSPEYRTPEPVGAWADGAAQARMRRDWAAEHILGVRAELACRARTVDHWAASHARGVHAEVTR